MKFAGVRIVSRNAWRTVGDRRLRRGRLGKSCGTTVGVPAHRVQFPVSPSRASTARERNHRINPETRSRRIVRASSHPAGSSAAPASWAGPGARYPRSRARERTFARSSSSPASPPCRTDYDAGRPRARSVWANRRVMTRRCVPRPGHRAHARRPRARHVASRVSRTRARARSHG